RTAPRSGTAGSTGDRAARAAASPGRAAGGRRATPPGQPRAPSARRSATARLPRPLRQTTPWLAGGRRPMAGTTSRQSNPLAGSALGPVEPLLALVEVRGHRLADLREPGLGRDLLALRQVVVRDDPHRQLDELALRIADDPERIQPLLHALDLLPQHLPVQH